MIDSMDITKETRALPTDTSNEPPPIHQIPPIPNPPPLIASPSSPSNLETSSKTMDSRQILKPVAPSKRPGTERPTQNSRDNPDVENAFLPKELADIIAIRQRRERAWHARLMICTTIISNLESALANFTRDIEIEEAVALKSYLRQAVTNYAAADSPPSPPCVPSHTRPNKGNAKGKEKELNITKKVAVATPKIILSQGSNRASTKEVEKTRAISTINDSWATVARNGQKKARVAHTIDLQVNTGIRGAQKLANKEKSANIVSDKRLFVRLPLEHEWRNLSPAGIREVIVKKLMISPSLIGKIKPVRSGFALSPCSTEARDTILNTVTKPSWL